MDSDFKLLIILLALSTSSLAACTKTPADQMAQLPHVSQATPLAVSGDMAPMNPQDAPTYLPSPPANIQPPPSRGDFSTQASTGWMYVGKWGRWVYVSQVFFGWAFYNDPITGRWEWTYGI